MNTSTNPDSVTNRILDLDALRQRVPLDPSTIWRMETRGEFPQRIRLGDRRVGWHESEIDQWLADRPRGCARPPQTLKRKRG